MSKLDFKSLEDIKQNEIEEIVARLDEISKISGRNKKLEILKEKCDKPYFKSYFQLVFESSLVWENITEHLKAVDDPICVTWVSFGHLIDYLMKVSPATDEGINIYSRVYAGLNDSWRTALVNVFDKSLHCGLGDKGINMAFPQLINIPLYMRCSLPTKVPLDTLPWADGIYSQEKADGMFVNIDYSNNPKDIKFVFSSRQGRIFRPRFLFGKAEKAYLKFLEYVLRPNFRTHGEMLVLKKEPGALRVLPREEGNGILNSVLQGTPIPENHFVQFVVWDAIGLQHTVPMNHCKRAYNFRFNMLCKTYIAGLGELREKGCEFKEFLPLKIIPTTIVYSKEEALADYRRNLQEGKEGTVLKTQTGSWHDGTSTEQIKLKLTVDCDLEVISLEEGKGKYANLFGSLKCKTSDGLLEVSVSGFDDMTREVFYNNADSLIGKIIAVRFNGVMKPKQEGEKASLFLPRFIELREDKTKADSYEDVLNIQASAIKG